MNIGDRVVMLDPQKLGWMLGDTIGTVVSLYRDEATFSHVGVKWDGLDTTGRVLSTDLKVVHGTEQVPAITISKGGTGERTIAINAIHVPDLWHTAMKLEDMGDYAAAQEVLDAWHLAHAMKEHLQALPVPSDGIEEKPVVVELPAVGLVANNDVTYQWCMESLTEAGACVDINYCDDPSGIAGMAACAPTDRLQVCLLRSVSNEIDGEVSSDVAYMVYGELPDKFEYTGISIPMWIRDRLREVGEQESSS